LFNLSPEALTFSELPALTPFLMSYYQLSRISNSDLTIAAHILQGIPYQKPETAFRLGGAFHELLLEPEKFRTENCEGLDLPCCTACTER
jgi:hypothetical protein